MAAFDGEACVETAGPVSDPQQHLAACSSCRQWLQEFESMNGRFRQLAYPRTRVDLWSTVERRIGHSRLSLTHRLWFIGGVVLAWRAVQLVIDLPFPMVHPFVPLAAAVVALWQIAGDPLAIETFAPELQK
jgi:predicted anti-sigma-YlaC factor YlaD